MAKKITANPKAVEAKAKKEDKKRGESDAKQKEHDDAAWVDDDKHNNKKAQRKDDKDTKRIQQLDKKKELQSLAEKELSDMAPKKLAPVKITHFNLSQTKEKAMEANKVKPKEEDIIHQNVNRVKVEGDEARTIEEALKVLGVEDKSDRHAEKRVKGCYIAFEERRMPELKAEHPGLRLTQLKQILSKEFEKSAENPKNMAHISYNFKAQKSIPEL